MIYCFQGPLIIMYFKHVKPSMATCPENIKMYIGRQDYISVFIMYLKYKTEDINKKLHNKH